MVSVIIRTHNVPHLKQQSGDAGAISSFIGNTWKQIFLEGILDIPGSLWFPLPPQGRKADLRGNAVAGKDCRVFSQLLEETLS